MADHNDHKALDPKHLPPPHASLTKEDALCINTIRVLAVDMVQKANSGHPGTAYRNDVCILSRRRDVTQLLLLLLVETVHVPFGSPYVGRANVMLTRYAHGYGPHRARAVAQADERQPCQPQMGKCPSL